MFDSKEKGNAVSPGQTTLVAAGTEIEGDIKFSGQLSIAGVVRGKIIAAPGKNATVRIIHKGRVEGEIRAPSVIINGEMVGDIHSSKHLEMESEARVQGQVYYALVEMNIGAEVNGGLNHRLEETAPEPDQRRGGKATPDVAVSAERA